MIFVNTSRIARSPRSPIVQELRWAHDTTVLAELAGGAPAGVVTAVMTRSPARLARAGLPRRPARAPHPERRARRPPPRPPPASPRRNAGDRRHAAASLRPRRPR